MKGKSRTCVNCKTFLVKQKSKFEIDLVCDKKDVVLLAGVDAFIITGSYGHGVEMRCFEK